MVAWRGRLVLLAGLPGGPSQPLATRLLIELQVSMGQPHLMKVLLHDTVLGIQGKGRKRRQLQAKLSAQLRPKPNISHIVGLCLERMSTWWHAPAADYDLGGRITELVRAASKGSPYTAWGLARTLSNCWQTSGRGEARFTCIFGCAATAAVRHYLTSPRLLAAILGAPLAAIDDTLTLAEIMGVTPFADGAP